MNDRKAGRGSKEERQPDALVRRAVVWRRFNLPILAGLTLLWSSLPPLNWWPCAWLFPLFFIRCVTASELPGRRPYLRMWVLGGIFWIAVLQGVRLAHWANYFGLLGLGFYFGAFWPLFLGAARSLYHRYRFPVPIAMSLAWVGAEWLRGQGPVGFSGACLSHSQVALTPVIQIADLAGAYLLSWLIMAASAAAASRLWARTLRQRVVWISMAVALVAADLGYGWYRLNEPPPKDSRQPLRVAIIQGCIDTDFGADPSRPERMVRQYGELTFEARREYGPIDVVVWPESMFPADAIVLESDAEVLGERGYRRDDLLASQANYDRLVRNLVRGLNLSADGQVSAHPTWLVLGVVVWHFDEHTSRRYNSAMLYDPTGKLRGRYDKMHPVLFGEYIPLGEVFPWLYRLTPMSDGLTAGEQARAFEIEGWRFSPSICFESTVPHLIRDQTVDLIRRGVSPDTLLNLTNDGWFWGSSILDIQLHCGVFRAVENRRPLLVAANTGLSAWIDGNGRMLAVGPRHDTGTILALPTADGRSCVYHTVGDWPWITSLLVGLSAILVARRRSESDADDAESS